MQSEERLSRKKDRPCVSIVAPAEERAMVKVIEIIRYDFLISSATIEKIMLIRDAGSAVLNILRITYSQNNNKPVSKCFWWT